MPRSSIRSSSQNKSNAGVLYHCDYCQRDISSEVRIRCGECVDFDLCLYCFSVGVEIETHSNDHSYRIIDSWRKTVLTNDWGADEEILLLEGLEAFGFGNWDDISNHMSTRSAIQCEKHYHDVYITSEAFPIASTSYDETFNKKIIERDGLIIHSKSQLFNFNIHEKIIDSPYLEAPISKKSAGKPKTLKSDPANKSGSQLTLAQLAGYMPLRRDFETEFENNVETPISTIEFTEDDLPEDLELKIVTLHAYNEVLAERRRRKDFLIEKDIVTTKGANLEKKRSKDPIYAKIVKFARFQKDVDNEEFFNGLVQERDLRFRIEQLKEFRRAGIHTLSEGEIYLEKKEIRDINEATDSAIGEESFSISRKHDREGYSIGSGYSRYGRRYKSTSINKKKRTKMDLLSDKEKELCKNINLTPEDYIRVKEEFIYTNTRHGFLGKPESKKRKLKKLDIIQKKRLYEFFKDSGWIKK